MAVNESLYIVELRIARHYADRLAHIHVQYQHGGASMTAALLAFDAEWSQIRQWHQRATAAAAGDIDFARLVTQFARFMLTARQTYAERTDWLQSALDAARDLNDSVNEAFMLQELSYIALDRGETEKSRTYAEQSLQAALRSGNESSILWSHIRIANAARWMGELEVAEKFCQKALASTAVDKDAKVVIYNILAQVAMHRGAFARAIEFTDKMIEIIYQLGNLQRLAIAFHSLAIFYFMLGDLDHAEHSLSESLHLVRLLGDRKGLPNGLMMRALIALELGQLSEAHNYTAEQESVAREVASPIQIMLAQTQFGAIERLRGNYLEARKYYETAITSAQAIQNSTVEMDTLLGLTRLALDSGQYAEASAYCHSLLAERNAPYVDPSMIWEPHLGLGLIANANGQHDLALTHFQNALPFANEVTTSLLEIYWALAETYFQIGNLSAAQNCVQQAEIVEQKSSQRQFPRFTSIRAVEVKIYLRKGEMELARDALRDALHRGQRLELIMPQIHVIEATAEYLAAIKDIRCISLFSLVAHHPASNATMGNLMERRRQVIASDYDADTAVACWEQSQYDSLDSLIRELSAEFSSPVS